jgi:protein TonB
MSSRASVSSVSTSASSAVRLAEEYLVRGRIKEALSIYRVIWETEPGNPAIKSRLAELCGLADESSNSIEVLAEVARIHIGQRNTGSAIASLNRASRLDPSSDPNTLVDIAGLCRKCDLTGEAERYYLKAAAIYEATGKFAKLEAAYRSAGDVAPANAEIQMKLGVVCQRLGKVEDSYRAFMKAAAEFSKKGDDRAALNAYGKAVKVGLAGAEAANSANAAAEALPELASPAPARIGEEVGAGERQPDSGFQSGDVPSGEPILPRGKPAAPGSRPESIDNELVRKIATAEMMFGFGRPDRAIALLKDLLGQEPNDPRIHLKLKDIYLRSRMPEEAAGVCRELARIYALEGNSELAADCMSDARRLSGGPTDTAVQSSSRTTSGRAPGGEPTRMALPAQRTAPHQASTTTLPRPNETGTEGVIHTKPAAAADADLSAGSFGVRLRGAATKPKEEGKPRYWPAVLVLVATLGMMGVYLLTRGNKPTTSVASETSLAQPEPAASVDSPVVEAVPETQSEPSVESGRRVENRGRQPVNQSDNRTDDGRARRVAQSPGEAPNSTVTEDASLRKAEKPNPSPPLVSPIGSGPSTDGGVRNIAPGGLNAQVEVPPQPPVPVARRSVVMGGGEVLKRVSPSYPQAARSAHITGTVTVELSINEKGNVVSARATSGPPLLAGAAESAARGFKFTPITLDGVPVKSNRTVLFHFKE